MLRLVRWLFLGGIIAYLVRELYLIGIREILRSLPTEPLFYVLFGMLFLLLPVAEVFMYRISWDFQGIRSLPVFVKKRIYNKEVLGYSGEVYFFSWARRHVGLTERALLETIRDNNILSSAASTLVALVLLGVFLLVGEITLDRLFGGGLTAWAIGGLVVTLLLIPLVIRYRRFLFSMSPRVAWSVFGIQCGRLLLGQALQIGQWAVVIPEVGMDVWFTFAAVSIILTRIPFLPNQNLIFMGAGVELSAYLDLPMAPVAAMLLVTNVLEKALNLALFGLISLREPSANHSEAARVDDSTAVTEP